MRKNDPYIIDDRGLKTERFSALFVVRESNASFACRRSMRPAFSGAEGGKTRTTGMTSAVYE